LVHIRWINHGARSTELYNPLPHGTSNHVIFYRFM